MRLSRFIFTKMPSIPRSVLITGANRGIGLGLVKHFLKLNQVEYVFATTRSVAKAKELNDIQKIDNRLHVVQMDICDDETIKKSVEEVSAVVGDHGLDMLINNAAIHIRFHFEDPPNRANVESTFQTNAIGQLMATQYFFPLIRKGATVSHPHSVIFISTVLGSLTSDPMRGSSCFDMMDYKMTKAGVNKLCDTLAADYESEPLIFVSSYPGHVATDMGGDNAKITIDECCSGLVDSFTKLTEEHSGKMLNADMEILPL